MLKKTPSLSRIFPESEIERETTPTQKKKIVDIETLEKRLSSSLEKLFKRLRIFALKLENLSARLSKKFQERSKVLSDSKKDYWGKFDKK